MNSNSLIHINGAYTIGYMYSNIRGGSKGKSLDLFIPRAIIKNISAPNNLFLREGLLILRNQMNGHILKDLKLSDRVKLTEAKRIMLDEVAYTFGVNKYTHLNF